MAVRRESGVKSICIRMGWFPTNSNPQATGTGKFTLRRADDSTSKTGRRRHQPHYAPSSRPRDHSKIEQSLQCRSPHAHSFLSVKRLKPKPKSSTHQNELLFGTACLDIVETSHPTTTNASKILSQIIQYIPLSESRKIMFDVTM
jgi:hypothetical protein